VSPIPSGADCRTAFKTARRRCGQGLWHGWQRRVAQPPRRAGQPQQAVHPPGLPLQSGRPQPADAVVAGECRGDVGGSRTVEERAERHGVLEGLAAALTEVGGHRVGGVAEQGHPPDGRVGSGATSRTVSATCTSRGSVPARSAPTVGCQSA
jgi:hypothetical protein